MRKGKKWRRGRKRGKEGSAEPLSKNINNIMFGTHVSTYLFLGLYTVHTSKHVLLSKMENGYIQR
jgi:hypothetical protein